VRTYRGVVAPGPVGDGVILLGDNVIPPFPLGVARAHAQAADQLPQVVFRHQPLDPTSHQRAAKHKRSGKGAAAANAQGEYGVTKPTLRRSRWMPPREPPRWPRRRRPDRHHRGGGGGGRRGRRRWPTRPVGRGAARGQRRCREGPPPARSWLVPRRALRLRCSLPPHEERLESRPPRFVGWRFVP
jgi:hypothetical protein